MPDTLLMMQPLLDTIAHMPLPDGGQPARRIFHGRGGSHPGCEQWTLDVFAPALLVTSFAPVAPEQVAALEQALRQRYAAAGRDDLTWVLQVRGGKDASSTQLMAGSLPTPHTVSEDGAHYLVQLLHGQNHGLFLDMSAGRRWLAQQVTALCSQGDSAVRVLNLFAYTCAFSVVALRAGAAQVINVDMARGAMNVGRDNHRLNGVAAGAQFWVHDIFNSWGKIGRAGPYELVVVDPPSYQKGSFVAGKDYARLVRRLPDLLAPGGQALLCLNAPELGEDFLRQTVIEHAPGLEFVERLANPPAFVDVNVQRALKVLVFRLGR